MKLFNLIIFLSSFLLLSGCGTSKIIIIENSKITFDISKINEEGLIGDSNSWRSLDYEFCIPKGEKYEQEVKEIDPSIMIHLNSKGRINCSKQENLCIGNTHQKNFDSILFRLAGLDYVKRIDRCFYE